jgi:hypothetical protein
MSNVVYIPSLNPVQFYWTEKPFPVGKNQYMLGEDWFSRQIPNWYQKIDYPQKWQTSDNIYLQYQSNFGPGAWQIINCSGVVISSGDFAEMLTVPSGQLYKYYEATIPMAGIDEGTKYIVLNIGFGETIMQWISEPLSIAASHPGTLLFTYGANGDYMDVWFYGGQTFAFRCEAILNQYLPGSKTKLYEDQIMNTVQLSSVPFDEYTLQLGGSYGLPDWAARKMNMNLCCPTVFAEQLQIVKAAEDGKLTPNRIELYPMAGWSMQVRPAKNSYGDLADTDFNLKRRIAYNIDANVFGTMNNIPTNNTIQIIESK